MNHRRVIRAAELQQPEPKDPVTIWHKIAMVLFVIAILMLMEYIWLVVL